MHRKMDWRVLIRIVGMAVGLSALVVWVPAAAETDPVKTSFVYQKVKASALSPPVGVTIDADNSSRYAELIDPAVMTLITAGNLEIRVGQPTAFPVHPAYIEATQKHWRQVTLGQEPGVLQDYIAGRPFPKISDEDPRAGDKIAWNMRYAYAPDESEVEEFYWQYRNMRTGKVERNLAMYGRMLRYKHRHTSETVPDLPNNRGDLYNALYLQVKKPPDIANTQLLIHRQADDTRQEQAWIYHASQRRVRRLATGQTTDAFLGSDIMIEDFLGYNGRVMDMVWRYRGTQWLLAPMYRHQALPVMGETPEADNFQLIPFAGQGGCFPEVTWQLRRVYRLDAVPRDTNHPLSRRTFYVDTQTALPVLIKIYDRGEQLWKLSIVGISDSDYHHPDNKGWQGAITEAVAMIDLQAAHCTTLQLLPRLPEQPLRPNQFSVQFLRAHGR